MSIFSNPKNNKKFFLIIAIFLLIFLVIYLFLKETNKKDLSKVNEEFKIENDDSPNEPEREKTIDSQKVVKEKLEKEVKPNPKKKLNLLKKNQ